MVTIRHKVINLENKVRELESDMRKLKEELNKKCNCQEVKDADIPKES